MLKAAKGITFTIPQGAYAMRVEWGNYKGLSFGDQARLVTGAALAELETGIVP